MRITIINHSDTRGGASVAAYRQMQALRQTGHDARMLVMHRGSNDPNVEQLQPAWRRKACFLAECFQIYSHNGFSRSRLFKASTGSIGMAVSQHPWVKEADAVILHWVNQGMLSLSEIARIEAPIAWVMHDMWCLTGLCHHAGNCHRYSDVCGSCKLLTSKPANDVGTPKHDLATATQAHKARLYGLRPITFVPVSSWLARCCNQSSLMKHAGVQTIANAFPVDDFSLTPKFSRDHYGLPQNKKLILMGAARLDDDIKGLPMAIEALNQLQGMEVAAIFFGTLRNADALRDLKLEHVHLGPISDNDTLRDLYAHGSVVLSSSHYETLPTTLIEGMAAGCVPVTYGQGGQTDIVDHLRTGYIAQYPQANDLAAGLRWALDAQIDPQQLRLEIKNKFSAESIAQKWQLLLQKITNKNN